MSKTVPFAPTVLMLGNIITGMCVLAPAGMLPELAEGLGVTIEDVALLMTFGAVVLCIGSPLMAWLTSRIDRRLLLGTSLLAMALMSLASAVAPSYAALLLARLVMLAVGVLYTPQAGGTATLIVPPERRGSAIAYLFLGWSLAAAAGLPLIAFGVHQIGWRAIYAVIGIAGLASAALVFWRVPRGLFTEPVDLRTWASVGRNPLILTLLAITTLLIGGQFLTYTFLGPLLKALTNAEPAAIAAVFAIYGFAGVAGNLFASSVVGGWGAYRTSAFFAVLIVIGSAVWSFGAGSLPIMSLGAALWGFGFVASNSMQQVRLIAADPALSGATVSLNTSALYVGQGIGSAIGTALYTQQLHHAFGFASLAMVTLALVLILATRRGAPSA